MQYTMLSVPLSVLSIGLNILIILALLIILAGRARGDHRLRYGDRIPSARTLRRRQAAAAAAPQQQQQVIPPLDPENPDVEVTY